MYVAAFFTPKVGEAPSARTLVDMPVPTTGAMWEAIAGTIRSDILRDNALQVSEANSALHWPLAFPAVMARGGFDAVVGNPPWEVSQLNETEFFAARDEKIAALPGDKRKRAIAKLETENPTLWNEFQIAKRGFEANNTSFVHQSDLKKRLWGNSTLLFVCRTFLKTRSTCKAKRNNCSNIPLAGDCRYRRRA